MMKTNSLDCEEEGLGRGWSSCEEKGLGRGRSRDDGKLVPGVWGKRLGARAVKR